MILTEHLFQRAGEQDVSLMTQYIYRISVFEIAINWYVDIVENIFGNFFNGFLSQIKSDQ